MLYTYEESIIIVNTKVSDDQYFILLVKVLMFNVDSGDPWFNGPWFVRPSETIHPPTRLFYKNEVFLSSIEDTNPMRSICGKCHVMIYKDYTSSK